MYFFIFWETDSFTVQPLDMCPEIEIFPFNLPGICFPGGMFCRWNIFFVTFPIVSIITSYRKKRKFVHQAGTAPVRPPAIMPGEDYTALSFSSAPCPSLIFFVPGITPEFISFWIYFNFQFRWRQPMIHKVRIYFWGLFFRNSEITVSLDTARFLLMSLAPQLFRVCCSICSFIPGFQALYLYSLWKLLPHSLQRQRCVPFSLRPFFIKSVLPQSRHLISIYCFIMTEQYTIQRV